MLTKNDVTVTVVQAAQCVLWWTCGSVLGHHHFQITYSVAMVTK